MLGNRVGVSLLLTLALGIRGTAVAGLSSRAPVVSQALALRVGEFRGALSSAHPGTASVQALQASSWAQASRTIRLVSSEGSPGGTVAIAVELVSQGDENAVGFSLTFDPSVLGSPQVALGSGAASANLVPNVNQAGSGRVGILLALPNGQVFSAGTRQLVVATFSIASSATAPSTAIGFGDQPIQREVSSAAAEPLATEYTGGTVTIKSECLKPAITSLAVDPADLAVAAGQTATLAVTATGTPAPTYQWWQWTAAQGWFPLAGQTGPTFTTPPVTTGLAYQARVTNACGTASSAVVNIQVKACQIPVITALTSNPASLEAPRGQTVSFTVAATGTPAPAYQWWQWTAGQGWFPLAGQTSPSFTTPPLLTNLAYQVRVSNSCGTASSAVLNVRVKECETPVITALTADPPSLEALSGRTVTLTVAATGAPAPIYEWWQWTAAQGWFPLAGQTGPTFTTPPLVTNLAYQVRVSNSCGTVSSAVLNVKVKACEMPAVTALTAAPAGLEAVSGQTVTLTVAATGTPAPAYQWWQWTAAQGWFPLAGQTGPTFTTPPLVTNLAYQVRVSNSCGTASSEVVNIKVKTCEKPAVVSLTVDPASRSVTSGQTATLTVAATGTPAPTYQWRQWTVERGWFALTGQTGSSLTTPPVTTDLAYQVVVSNACGDAASEVVNLGVNQPPTARILYRVGDGEFREPPAAGVPVSVDTAAATTITLDAGASTDDGGLANLTLSWVLATSITGGSGATLSGSAGQTATVNVLSGTRGSLTVTLKTTDQQGAPNSASIAFECAPVCAAPAITQQPRSQKIFKGQSVRLEVRATGGDLRYQWHRRTASGVVPIAGATQSVFDSGPIADLQRFFVRVSNACAGVDSATADVTVWMAGERYEIDPLAGNLMFVPDTGPGGYLQGSPENPAEPGRNSDEKQFTHVLTRSLSVMETEVTRRVWNNLRSWQAELPADPSIVAFSSSLDDPVQGVQWYEAVLFANLLSLQRGLTPCYYGDPAFANPIARLNEVTNVVFWKADANGYRLPTEGEREWFARAGTLGPFSLSEPSYGNAALECPNRGTLSELEQAAWFCANSGGKTHPAGLLKANPWGLKDIHGNVWEWCWDWYGAYPSSPRTDYAGPGWTFSNIERVIRGGDWYGGAQNQRSARRYPCRPGSVLSGVGMRLVRSLTSAAAPTAGPHGIEFVAIPAGEFMMGCDSSQAFFDEQPVHRVRITQPSLPGAPHGPRQVGRAGPARREATRRPAKL